MGGKQSSEANGIKEGCAGCRINLPPANPNFDFLKACDMEGGNLTYCFWTRADSKATITQGIGFGMDQMGGFSANASLSVTVEEGVRLFKYFRICGKNEYWCSACFCKNHPRIAKSVLLELHGKGQVVTTELELVKIIEARKQWDIYQNE